MRVAAFALLLLAACDRGPSPDELIARDARRAESTDPAVTDALSDPILADRGLRAADDSLRVRTTPAPTPMLIPPDDGEPPILSPVARCDGPFAREAAFARDLPPAFRPPDARLVEAAGRDAPGCRIRFARFQLAAPPPVAAAVLETQVRAAGLPVQRNAQGEETVVSGATPTLAYTLLIERAGSGASVLAIVNLAPPTPQP